VHETVEFERKVKIKTIDFRSFYNTTDLAIKRLC